MNIEKRKALWGISSKHYWESIAYKTELSGITVTFNTRQFISNKNYNSDNYRLKVK